MSIYTSKTYTNDLFEAAEHSVGIERLRGKSLLITGATGTIGSFLADTLLEYNTQTDAQITLYLAGRNIKKLQDRFTAHISDHLHFIQYDMLKPIQLNNEVDYIIHASGNAHPAAFSTDPVGTIAGNINSTYNLLEYARHHKTSRLLYLSSGEVYGQGDLNLQNYTEEYAGYVDIMSPRSCYPSSKRTTENLCAAYYSQYGLETVIARPCHTYGPTMTESDNRATVQFFKNALNRENIIMKSAGTQLRSYCYAADCVSALLTLLINGHSGEAYNCANPDSVITIAGFAQVIAELSGTQVIFQNPSQLDAAQQSPIAKQVLNTEKLEKLGWKGQFSIRQGTQHMLDILNHINNTQ